MSYDTRVSGELSIDPPLTWSEMKDNPLLPDRMLTEDPFRPGGRSHLRETGIVLKLDEETVETDEGTLVRKTCRSAEPRWDDPAGYGYLLKDVQLMLNFFPGHTVRGYLECHGEEPGDLWRVVIRDGEAVRIDPKIVWDKD